MLKRYFPGVLYDRLDMSIPPLSRAKIMEDFNTNNGGSYMSFN